MDDDDADAEADEAADITAKGDRKGISVLDPTPAVLLKDPPPMFPDPPPLPLLLPPPPPPLPPRIPDVLDPVVLATPDPEPAIDPELACAYALPPPKVDMAVSPIASLKCFNLGIHPRIVRRVESVKWSKLDRPRYSSLAKYFRFNSPAS